MIGVLRIVILALSPMVAVAADAPEWAYPVAPKPEPQDNVILRQMPGSSRQYTQAQINDPFSAPDWYPDDHPAMPEVVAHGTKPGVQACARCHLPLGNGHPESSSLAGLPAAYLVRQMAEFKSGARKGARAKNMITFAEAISDENVRAASEYFAALKPGVWTKVIETDSVPKSYVGEGAMRFALAEGGSEAIGNRIIELPQDEMRAKSRDARSGFVAHVPPGSLAKGEVLVTTGGGGKTIECAICHGPTLKGLGEVPSIAGRSPQYIFRQLNDMQTGQRSGVWTLLMKRVVEKLSGDDMLAIAAYLAAREP